MVSFDPTTLNAEAAKVAASAAVLADTQAQLRQLATSMTWQSPAAGACANALSALLIQAGASRWLTLELAEALRRHCQVATRRAEELTRAGDLVGSVVSAAGRLL